MPDSTTFRRDLIERALEVLLEESRQAVSIQFPLANGDTLHIEVRREKPVEARSEPLASPLAVRR